MAPWSDWPKSQEAISADITRRPPAKRVGFAGCVCACPGGSWRSCTSDLTLIRGALLLTELQTQLCSPHVESRRRAAAPISRTGNLGWTLAPQWGASFL